jgi:prepilin-type processing-associated H-X9-DG protein
MNSYLAAHNRFGLGKVRPAALPAFFDSRVGQGALRNTGSDEPPPCEDHEIGGDSYFYSAAVAINRHQGGLNMLFLDGAVRKVGVKELWTLKWSERFETDGPWTKAGGALPEDWPQWLRTFKDY